MITNLFNIVQEIHDNVKKREVFQEKIFDNGRRFVYRYYGNDIASVVNKVEDVVHNIETYRCPSHELPYKYGEYWACDVKYYWLD